MILNILFLLLGLGLILVGANMLTDGSASVARRFGLSDLVVGLTVVAFGTSTPELAISVSAAVKGSAGLAVGNVVGSNIFNILAIIGITAMIKPINVTRDVMNNQIPLVALSSLLLLVIGNAAFLDGEPVSIVTRVDGIILLIFFMLFMRQTLQSARQGKRDEAATEGAKNMSLAKSLIFIAVGLGGLIGGGNLFVGGASAIAEAMGVSEAVIGLTIVAAGTSLPELATSVVAAVKGNADLALGNVIGSNVFNIFMVLGASATIRQLPFAGVTQTDLLTLMLASALFWVFGRHIGRSVFTRGEGAALVLVYMAYMSWLVATA